MLQLIAAACLLIQDADAAADDPDLAWMEGRWRSMDEGRISEEFWTDADGGLALGVNRSLVDGRAVAFEFLRIGRAEDGWRYCAQPGGGEAVCFAMTFHHDAEIRFENPDHDFPQVIEYFRSGDVLWAQISDLEGEQRIGFRWMRVSD